MQPEVADGRSGMKMRDKLVFREGNNKHRAVAVNTLGNGNVFWCLGGKVAHNSL